MLTLRKLSHSLRFFQDIVFYSSKTIEPLRNSLTSVRQKSAINPGMIFRALRVFLKFQCETLYKSSIKAKKDYMINYSYIWWLRG